VAFLSVFSCTCVITGAIICASPILAKAESKQPLTPEACTEVRYLAQDQLTNRPAVQLSLDGQHAAYVLQVPDVAANDNKDELYVKAVDEKLTANPEPVLIGDLITAIHWFPDNRHLAALVHRGKRVVLVRIDSEARTETLIWEAPADITDFSMDMAGTTIAVTVRANHNTVVPSKTSQDDPKGYRLDLTHTAHSAEPRRQVLILRIAKDQHWELKERVRFISPISGKEVEDIVDNHSMHISLSPNGQLLLMDNIEDYADIPPGSVWERSPMVRYMKNRGTIGLIVSYLYDVQTHKASMPLASPIARDGLWAPDSNSYVKVALAPAGSSWEAADLEKGTPNDHITHLFSVDVRTGDIKEILNRAEFPPVFWTESGEVIVRDPAGTLKTLRMVSGQWVQTGEVRIPLTNAAPYSPLESNGKVAVMEYETANTPPQIAAFDLGSGHAWIVARFNPEIDGFVLPKTQQITWTTSTGFTAKGLLLLPPDYDAHRRYPLVIEDGSILYTGEFVCDSGIRHVQSFARGILADTGIIYLTRYWPGIDEWESDHYPKGYPGSLAEAGFKQDLVESAVKTLDQRQIIDPANVGLIGFSRGGWYVEYTLAHSPVPFKAASAADNALYSTGEYWYWNNDDMARDEEGMYGGPPYGKSLENWLKYSISFNLDKIHTPLLMEVNGYGKKYDDPDQPPDNLAVHNEIFVGLSRLQKAVEYYYYPNEQHEPDHPQARVASLQRNVDWFRFWLQGYERPNPEDPDQYKRWEHLRELRDADARATAQAQAVSPKPN
jgi:dipeptidyl aminopeptidase/acylaminoacyl peptidase